MADGKASIPISNNWRVGVDIGGTFTDFVILTPDDKLERIKLLSTPDDYSRAITSGLRDNLSDAARAGVGAFVHGTTVATNAILEETSQKIALITTRGFRDVLELRRARRPHLYELNWEPPAPLVDRELRLEVGGRMDAQGAEVEPLNEADIDACIATLRGAGVAAVSFHRLPVHPWRGLRLPRRHGRHAVDAARSFSARGRGWHAAGEHRGGLRGGGG